MIDTESFLNIIFQVETLSHDPQNTGWTYQYLPPQVPVQLVYTVIPQYSWISGNSSKRLLMAAQ